MRDPGDPVELGISARDRSPLAHSAESPTGSSQKGRERSVISVSSAGANSRIGGPQKPVPRLT